jgi:hypothetical protein
MKDGYRFVDCDMHIMEPIDRERGARGGVGRRASRRRRQYLRVD